MSSWLNLLLGAVMGLTLAMQSSEGCGRVVDEPRGEGEPCTRTDECRVPLECNGGVCMQPGSDDAGPGEDAGGLDAGPLDSGPGLDGSMPEAGLDGSLPEAGLDGSPGDGGVDASTGDSGVDGSTGTDAGAGDAG